MRGMILAMFPRLFSGLILAQLILCADAWGRSVVINFPSFQGKAILARERLDHDEEVAVRAHMVCRLAGYARAQVEKGNVDKKTVYQLGGFVTPGDYFVPESVVADPRGVQGWGWWALYHDHVPPMVGGISTERTPKFVRRGKVNDCAKMAFCRGFDARSFNSLESNDFDWRHPFVNSCKPWASHLWSKEVFLFTQVTCQTRDEYKAVEDDMAAFHARTAEKLKVTSGNPVAMGLQFEDTVKSCAPFTRQTSGTLIAAAPYTCDFQPFDPILERYNLNVFAPTFMNYLMLTGRYVKGPRPGPPAVRQILDTYTRSVIPEEYSLSDQQLKDMKQPFCVDEVSSVSVKSTEAGSECSFTVKTRDFLQAKSSISVQLGIENDRSRIENHCDVLVKDFLHESLSCKNANFCPAPGLISRGKP